MVNVMVPPDVAREILWCFDRPGGYRPGGFREVLIGAIARADLANRARLAAGFPEVVAAYMMAADIEGGVEALLRFAESGEPVEVSFSPLTGGATWG